MPIKNNNYEVSVIIITYNSFYTIQDCLYSLYKLQLNLSFEVIIIDNNSEDKSVELIKSLQFKFNLIQNSSNIGFARACNQGIKISNGKYIFLLNPDTGLLNDAIGIFYDFMEKKENESIWCVGSQLFDAAGHPAKSYGRFPNLMDVIFEQFGIKGILLKIFGNKYFQKRNLVNDHKEIPFVMGCNMFIKPQALEKIGLFNEQFFLNFEETELSWRANKNGFKSLILPEAKILHYSKKSFTKLQPYLFHLWHGQLLFFKLTKSHFIFFITKVIHLFGALLRFVFKIDKEYLMHAKKILSI